MNDELTLQYLDYDQIMENHLLGLTQWMNRERQIHPEIEYKTFTKLSGVKGIIITKIGGE